jgi:hypothetical protein
MFPTRADRRTRLPSACRAGKGAIRAFTPVFDGLWRRAHGYNPRGHRRPAAAVLDLKERRREASAIAFRAFAHPTVCADRS